MMAYFYHGARPYLTLMVALFVSVQAVAAPSLSVCQKLYQVEVASNPFAEAEAFFSKVDQHMVSVDGLRSWSEGNLQRKFLSTKDWQEVQDILTADRLAGKSPREAAKRIIKLTTQREPKYRVWLSFVTGIKYFWAKWFSKKTFTPSEQWEMKVFGPNFAREVMQAELIKFNPEKFKEEQNTPSFRKRWLGDSTNLSIESFYLAAISLTQFIQTRDIHTVQNKFLAFLKIENYQFIPQTASGVEKYLAKIVIFMILSRVFTRLFNDRKYSNPELKLEMDQFLAGRKSAEEIQALKLTFFLQHLGQLPKVVLNRTLATLVFTLSVLDGFIAGYLQDQANHDINDNLPEPVPMDDVKDVGP